MDTYLTREYFALNNWEIVEHDPDETGFILWEAQWNRSMEKGSTYYAKLYVTNMMYDNRFCISGSTSKGSINIMVYTQEELLDVLKVLGINDYCKTKCNKY